MKVHTLLLGPMLNCTYIIENDRQAILIDPSWNMPEIINFLGNKKLKPAAVFFTHAHQDHMTNAEDFLKKYNLQGYLTADDMPFCELPENLLSLYKAPKTFEIAGLKIDTFPTPGHTKGSVCIKIGNNLFTGDTLFVNSVGRTDLPGANPDSLIKSLNFLANLPTETILYTGHSYGSSEDGYKSSIANELKTNPFLKLAKTNPKELEDIL